jgi:hypothetical protein
MSEKHAFIDPQITPRVNAVFPLHLSIDFEGGCDWANRILAQREIKGKSGDVMIERLKEEKE